MTAKPTVARPETPPSPHLILPFTRDPNFVDRAELALLEQKLDTSNRVALVGLGGIGCVSSPFAKVSNLLKS